MGGFASSGDIRHPGVPCPPQAPRRWEEHVAATLCPSPELYPTCAALSLFSPSPRLVSSSTTPFCLPHSRKSHWPPHCPSDVPGHVRRGVADNSARPCRPASGDIPVAGVLLPLTLGSEAPAEPRSRPPELPIPVPHPGQGSPGPGPGSDSAQHSQRSREKFRRNKKACARHTGLPLPSLGACCPLGPSSLRPGIGKPQPTSFSK